VEFSWDETKSSWLLRIQAGEEVIQRHYTLPKSADEQTLRTAIQKTVADVSAEIVRIDFERERRPKCGEAFDPKRPVNPKG